MAIKEIVRVARLLPRIKSNEWHYGESASIVSFEFGMSQNWQANNGLAKRPTAWEKAIGSEESKRMTMLKSYTARGIHMAVERSKSKGNKLKTQTKSQQDWPKIVRCIWVTQQSMRVALAAALMKTTWIWVNNMRKCCFISARVKYKVNVNRRFA